MSKNFQIKINILLLIILNCKLFSFEIFSISSAIAITSAIVYRSRDQIFNSFGYERCNSYWIRHDQNNLKELSNILKSKIYGQNFATNLISKAIESHVSNKAPLKPLVMSLHGWTGSGKTYTSLLIAESLYRKGLNSKNVHLWIGSLHFPHKNLESVYIDQIRNWITGNTTRCSNQLFIIDEMDFLSSALIDSIKPYLDYNPQVDGVNYRNNIYIFLSNSGGSDITKLMLEYWKKGKNRENLDWKEFSQLISQKAFNEKGGLWHSHLIDKFLIDIYIPYLPLERSHVILCAQDYLKDKIHKIEESRSELPYVYIPNQSEQLGIVNNVSLHLTYVPADLAVFSTSGCKLIANYVDLHYSQLRDEKHGSY